MGTFRANEPQVIHQTVDDETVIVDLGTGSYYSLRGSGQVIWSALDRGLDLAGVVDEVAGRFDGEMAEIAAAVEGFMTQLAEDRLIVPSDGPPKAGGPSGDGRGPGGSGVGSPRFEPPVIERFDDLQDLILLDPVHEVSEEEGWPHAKPNDGG